MNYRNWQEHHRQAFLSRSPRNIKPWKQDQNLIYSSITNEELRQKAWENLKCWCSAEQLERLNRLAGQYSRGERLAG